MKRKLIVAAIMMLFFVAVFGLSGCGLMSQTSDADLANAIGSENGPGSGNWKPQVPKNERQARQLFALLETLATKANEEAKAYDGRYLDCFDENGKLLDGKDEEECVKPLMASIAKLKVFYTDFGAGWRAYHGYKVESGEDLPSVNNLIIPPLSPSTEGLKVPSTEDGWYCLTCTHGIAPEYVFQPVEIALSNN